MFTVTTVGPARTNWCRYHEVASLGNGASVRRVLAACPSLALRDDPRRREVLDKTVDGLIRLEASPGNPHPLLRFLAGLSAAAAEASPLDLAAGLFTGRRGILASTGHLVAYRCLPRPVARVPVDRVSADGALTAGDIQVVHLHGAGTLSAVVLSASHEPLPFSVAEQVLGQVTDPRQTVAQLALWLRRSTAPRPLLLLSFGQDHHSNAETVTFPQASEAAVTAAGTRAAGFQPALSGVEKELAALRASIELLDQRVSATSRESLERDEKALRILSGYPAEEFVRRLVDHFSAVEDQHLWNHGLLPVCTHIMNLCDTLETDNQDLPSDLRGLLAPLHQALLGTLDLCGVQPFHHPGEQFDPVTQECIHSELADGECYVLQRVHPGYRRGEQIIRREKVILRRVGPADLQEGARYE